MSGTTFSPTDLAHAVVSEAPAPFVPRKRTLQIGTAAFTAIWVMYFGGLFGAYVSSRNTWKLEQDGLAAAGERVSSWIPDSAQVELTAPTIMTWTLLMSCITMQWAVYSFKRSDRRHGLLALATQAMFGAAVINQVVFQWKQLGLVIDDTSGSSAATLIYTITASHVAMIIVAMCLLAFAAFRALASSDTKDHVDVVASAATFWYAMVGLYFIIWILIFITK
ncbi:MAG: cytochrome c oxidase subunit 3 [Acidimicrobiales bacterium]|jgi:heme/copper-type cytochrome/quinol oxidase subunit 3